MTTNNKIKTLKKENVGDDVFNNDRKTRHFSFNERLRLKINKVNDINIITPNGAPNIMIELPKKVESYKAS
ncbi:hypothetical protein NUITMVP1_00590 [Proteus mirabilis]|nr:hypothetical protein NUITMVP1_00590 [Proteus mirabilis]